MLCFTAEIGPVIIPSVVIERLIAGRPASPCRVQLLRNAGYHEVINMLRFLENREVRSRIGLLANSHGWNVFDSTSDGSTCTTRHANRNSGRPEVDV